MDIALIGTAQVRVTPDMTALTSRSFGSKMARVGKVAGLALAGAFVIETKKAIETTQELTKSTISLHKNLGLTNRVASQWGAVAKARGVDSNKLGMAFKTLATQVEGARSGSASAQAQFKALGITQKDLEQGAKNIGGLLPKVADGFDKLGAGTARTTAESKLFGRGWQTIAPLMRDGSKALEENLGLTEKYGAVLQGKTLKQQEELLANTRESKIAWMGLQIQLSTLVTPALNDLHDQFQKIATINANPNLTGEEKWAKIATIIEDDVSKALDVVVDLIPTFAEHVGEAAPKVAGAFVKGFLDANVWGKLALGAWFFTKVGLTGAIMKAAAARLGLTFAGTFAAEAAAGGIAGGVAGGGAAAATGMFGTAAGAAGAGATAAGGASAAASLAGGAIAVAPALPLVAALKGIDETGLLDAGGPLADTKLGGLLGIHKTTWQVGAAGAMGYAKVLSSVTDELGHLGRAAPRSLEAVTDQAALMTRAGLDGGHLLAKNIESLKFQYGSLREAAKHLSKGQRVAWVNMAFEAEQSGDITRGQLQKMQKAFGTTGTAGRELRRDITGSFHTIADTTHEALQGLANDADRYLNRAADHGIKATGRLKDGAWANVKGLANAVAGGMRNIGGNLNKSLGAVGAKKLPFNIENVDQAVSLAQGGIVVPGTGSGDKVPLHLGGRLAAMVEPHELVSVANRTATADLMRHNSRVPRRAEGGVVGAANFGGHPSNVIPGIRDLIALMQSRFPLSVTSTTDHSVMTTSGNVSDHTTGNAVDLAASVGVMFQAAEWIKSSGLASKLKQGIHNPNLAINMGQNVGAGFFGPAVWGQHANHIHLALAGALSGQFGAAAQSIARVLLKGPAGPLRDLGQKALDKTRKAANSYLAKQAPAGGGGVSGPAGQMGGALSEAQIEALARSVGMPNPHLMAAIAMAESGGQVGVINSIGATGLWQVLQSAHPQYSVAQLTSARGNALAALQILNSEGLGAWEAYTNGAYARFMQRGGVIPPFAGDFGGGGVVPGPRGAPRTAIVHGQEHIGDGTPPVINLYASIFVGDHEITEIVRTEIDVAEGHGRQLARMHR